jgi:Tfp pilus assembly protein PilN
MGEGSSSVNDINFLPDRFLREQKRKSRVWREAGLVAAVAFVLVAWYGVMHGQVAGAERLLQARQDELAAANQQTTEMVRLQQEYTRLSHQSQIQERLCLPVAYTQVIAALSKLMPASLTMTRLAMTSESPGPTVAPRKSGTASAKSTAPPAPQPARSMMLEVTGFSPTDMDVANFVGRLSDYPLFANVKMRYSRTHRVDEAPARQFRIELEVPLDRRYTAGPKPPEELAHAN